MRSKPEDIMPNEIPSPASMQSFGFSTKGGSSDPRAAAIIADIRKRCKLEDRLNTILKTTPDIAAEDRDAFDLEKLSKLAARPVITPKDCVAVRIEIYEINGHVVYYLQPKQSLPLEVFLPEIVRPALGRVWDDFGVRGWLEAFPENGANEIWGIQIQNLVLNGLNDSFFKGLLPIAFNDRIAKAHAKIAGR
jgi:hypothetical protein